MDWNDTEAQASFRQEVRQLIETKLPERYHDGDGREWQDERRAGDAAAQAAAQEWAEALAERGWTAPHWPKEYGGAGLSPMEQFIFNQELALAGAPRRVGGQGVSQFGPTLILHGTDEQKSRHLPKILSGEVIWAQGYSEPGAGSDLASLQTRAVRDGDEYVVNGQKIWTSSGHYADWLYVLVRTDPEAPKHRGITLLLIDKATPGITLRPLVDMSDRHHFNETFFEDVRVPVANRVGEENRGWYIGATLLDFERSNITGTVASRRNLLRLLQHLDERKSDPSLRLNHGENLSQALKHQLTDCFIKSEVQMQFSLRIISIQESGRVPNYEASIAKLFGSELGQQIANTATKMFGLHGNLTAADDPRAPLDGRFTRDYMISVSGTIAAGTSEIQRNIIATRGLGLPRG